MVVEASPFSLLLHLADLEHENEDNEREQILTHHDTSPIGTAKTMLKFDRKRCKPFHLKERFLACIQREHFVLCSNGYCCGQGREHVRKGSV